VENGLREFRGTGGASEESLLGRSRMGWRTPAHLGLRPRRRLCLLSLPTRTTISLQIVLHALLSTKLYLPPPRPRLVARPRLTERLALGQTKPLTLISAPAGFGKTTLLSVWIPQSEQCVTWLSLDEGDDDPIRFWAYVIAALQLLHPDLGESARSLLQSPRPPPTPVFLTSLINDLVEYSEHFSFVLDDYHLITDQAIHDGIGYLLEHLPPPMHLILVTRADPPLPLARWRARDQLAELRADDLRFTPDEAAAFLDEVMGLSLSAADIAALEVRTEGWVAGLQLAALSMQGRGDVRGFVQAFSGSHRHILGYLVSEVLEGRPPGTLDFLLQTSILERMCAPLCEAVTGAAAGQAMLETLEQANLFVVPLDDEGRWYRYHHLFADVLRQRLRRAQPDQVPELHRRASAWHEANGSMAEAVTHALAAQNFERAARLVEIIGVTLFARPAVQSSLQGWLAALPASIVRGRPRLNLIRAWQSFVRLDVRGALGCVDEAEQAIPAAQPSLPAREAQNISAAIAGMRAFLHAFMPGPDLDQVRAWAEVALAGLEPDDHNFRGMAAGALGLVRLKLGAIAEAESAFAMAAAAGQAAGNVYMANAALANRMSALRALGRQREATSLCREAMEWMAKSKAQDFPSMTFLNLAQADFRRELNDLPGAQRHANESLQQADRGGYAAQALFSRFTLARVKQAQGDWDGALDLLGQVSDRLHQHAPVLHLTLPAAAAAQFQVGRGELEPALHWAQEADWEEGSLASVQSSRDLVWRYEHLWIARAQVFIAQGRASGDHDLLQEARAYLIRQQAVAKATGLAWYQIKLLALQALADHALGDVAQAAACLEQALALAEPEGYVRLFVDEGEPMREAIGDWKLQTGQHADQAAGRERFLAYADHLLAAFGDSAAQGMPASLQPSASSLVEPLSERELEVLRLIASGHTNQEIADLLVIAISTVKSHVNNLYSKLGVQRRTQAVALARELGLVSE
jgi:LuxR family maltose regulon positive regulatory protein